MPSFHDITGQQRGIRILQSFLKKKTPPSLLFEGNAGVGKRKAAETFAQAILCQSPIIESPSDTLENGASTSTAHLVAPCGSCLACRKMNSKNHPDFTVLEPDGNVIKIDQIREIQGKLVYPPVEGPKKIVLIDPADKMNGAAANALLKTLEEPPAYAILILISALGASLLPTLRSRCQKIVFHALSFPHIVETLMKEKGWTLSEAQHIAATATGGLKEALSMTVEEARGIDEQRHALISHADLFETASGFAGDSDLFETALSYLTTWFRDILVLKSLMNAQQDNPTLYPRKWNECQILFSWRHEEIKGWAAKWTLSEICNFLGNLQTVRDAQTRNVNRQLSLETLLLQLRKRKTTFT